MQQNQTKPMPHYSIYHNPRCSKSRQALQLLEEKDIVPEIVLYLKETPSKAAFKKVLAKLGKEPSALLRKGETIFKEKFKNARFTEEEWIDIMLEFPKLIERPIVIKDNKAVVGRPLENVEDLLD